MKLKKLQLENFRNYGTYQYDFSDEKNLIVLTGENGKGKTNIIEAVYLLSIGRSFRTLLHEDLIKHENDYLRLKGEIITDDEDCSLEVFCSVKPLKKKNFKKNDVNLKNSEYVGSLLTVLFHPEDLNMLYLSPSYRRKYLDILLSQTDKKYLSALTSYKKVLKQRGSLLNQIRDHKFAGKNYNHLLEELYTWDLELVNFGSLIIKDRTKLINYLKENLEVLYRQISGKNEKINVKYLNNVRKIEEFRDLLDAGHDKDIRYGKTTIGPHLDDFQFFIDNIEIAGGASRGEFRTLLLAVKLAEIEYIKEKTGKNPVLLLDDVFSELDLKRQQRLLKSIKGCQTLITTTDINNLKKLAKRAKI